jgi:hypothetical protein
MRHARDLRRRNRPEGRETPHAGRGERGILPLTAIINPIYYDETFHEGRTKQEAIWNIRQV